MKTVFLSTVFLVFSIATSFGQADSKSIDFGVKGGVNFSNIGGDDFRDVDSRTSFNVGLVLEVPISDRFSFQPELLYSGQGFDIREIDQDNVFDTDDNIEYQLDYIQVPLLLKAYLVKGLSVEAGPQFGFKINEEYDFQPTADGGDIEIDDEDSSIKKFDTSVALGSSYKFDSGFFLSARYTFGLTDVFEDDSIFQNVDAKNNVWQFGVGFMF
ncbi:porin family protein [Sediminibacter sp. Hel_I_10]|uniref:porin family protein n=1 Tax=Sediminibacter sp. Hel_I_10 TaxID=1392490 RepID=UPI00047B0706|nr:porin family protein [Sediminibacter sp. Hel_I_10]